MNSIIFLALFGALLFSFVNTQTLTKFQWKDLGSTTSQVEFLFIDVSPMPLMQPGVGKIDFKAKIKRPISGSLRTKLKIIRTISGLALPFSW
jgi:hypothetical protein